jgi:hypothetical protein
MPRVEIIIPKGREKEVRQRRKSWSPEERKFQALLLRQLRNGQFRPWEQLFGAPLNVSTPDTKQ